MTALVLCTPSIKEKVGIVPYYNCGMALPSRSYWRLRTVLGRVLGCLQGVTSCCGWIGPCPGVDFDPPLHEGSLPRHVRVKARRIAMTEHISYSDDNIFVSTTYAHSDALDIQPDEEFG